MISFSTYKFNDKEVDLTPRVPINLDGADVANLQQIFFLDKTAQKSSLELNVDGEFFELKKDTENFILNKQSDQSIFDLDSSLSRGDMFDFKISDIKSLFFYSSEVNASSLSSLILKNKKSVTQDKLNEQLQFKELIEQKKNVLFQDKTTEQKNSIERLLDIFVRLNLLNTEIDYYQNEKKLKEDLVSKLASKEKEKVVIAQKIDSVAVLTTQANAIKQQIQTLNVTNAPNNISERIQEIKRRRENVLEQNISHIRVSRLDEEDKSIEKIANFKLTPFITIILVEVLIGILFYLLSFNVTIIYIVIISLVVLVIPPVTFSFVNLSKKSSDSEALLSEPLEEEKVEDNTQEDSNILNLSLYNALNNELQKMATLMTQRLDGQSIDVLKAKLSSLDAEIEGVKKEQKLLESKSITSEEYYKKRREVDIMKIEKENLQMNFPDLETSAAELIDLNAKYSKINEGIESLDNFNSSFPIVVAAKTFTSDVDDLVKKETERQIVRIVTS